MDVVREEEAIVEASEPSCFGKSLTVGEMELYHRVAPRQAECLLDTWFRLRRDAEASSAAREKALEPTDAHLLDTMQSLRPGAIPGFPQSLADSPREAGRVSCGVKGVG
jgi:hypothetical protein